MCIIIDANIAGLVFNNPPDDDFLAVFNWLHNINSNGSMVLGGGLAKELFKLGSAKRYILALYRAGRAIIIPDEIVDPEECSLIIQGTCVSDDPHVIALARTSGARTLCSQDNDLHRDFKNPILINNPRGCIYQNNSHSHLLVHTSSCSNN